MVDQDLKIIMLREIIPHALSLGLKHPSYYKISELSWYLSLFGNLSMYYLFLFAYSEISASILKDAVEITTPFVKEIVKNRVFELNCDVLNKIFEEQAHKLMIENRQNILIIYCKVSNNFEYILENTYGSTLLNRAKVMDCFDKTFFEYIKNDKVLYNSLKNNDLVVNYITKILRESIFLGNFLEILGYF